MPHDCLFRLSIYFLARAKCDCGFVLPCKNSDSCGSNRTRGFSDGIFRRAPPSSHKKASRKFKFKKAKPNPSKRFQTMKFQQISSILLLVAASLSVTSAQSLRGLDRGLQLKSTCEGVHPTQSVDCKQRCIYPRFRNQKECSACDCYDLPDEDEEATTSSTTTPPPPTTNTASTNNNGTTNPASTNNNNTGNGQPPSVPVNFRPACVGPAPGDAGCRDVCNLGNFYKQDYCAACDRNCF